MAQANTRFGPYVFGPFLLDPAARELTRDGAPVVLPARAFDCLQYLIVHRERAVGRDELAQAVFGRSNVSDAQIGQIVLRARRAVSDDGQVQNAIRTVPRFGFRWIAPTRVVDTAAEMAVGEAVDAAAETDASKQVAREPPSRASAWRAALSLRTAAIALALLLLVGAALAWWWLRSAERDPAKEIAAATLVLPTQVAGAEAAWARLGLMDFIADRLRRAGLAVPPSESTLAMLGDPASDAANNGQRRVRSLAERRNGRWRVELEAIAADRTRSHATAEDADLLAAAALASDRLLSALGRRPPPGTADLDLAERLQRARAAMLGNEVGAARRILLAAPELQRDTPELLYQLARIEFREGRFEQGVAGLDRALRSPAGREPLFRARLLNARGAMYVRLQRPVQAERDYHAAAGLAGPAHALESAVALTGRGVARAMQQRFDAALADLGQARVQALRAGDALAVSRIDANLGQLEMERDRPAQALQYLEGAARDFERYGAINELLVARSALVAINLRLLRPHAAREQSELAWALRARVRDPAQLGALLLDRAEVLIRLGRLEQARELLQSPEGRRLAPAEERRRGLLAVEAAWRSGDARAAGQLASALLAEPAPDGGDPRLEGWLRLRQRQTALQADAVPEAWAAAASGPAWMSALSRALAERQAGREAAADGAYREALRAVEGGGVPEDVLEVVADYVPWLIERGRLAEASALVGRVAPWAEQDFAAAVLQLRLYRALGQDRLAQRALAQARALAGERPLPAGLQAELARLP
jgi:DNA-binding winged helix-turn-helix (wHTH) protein/tetratricopeptide (TPR) repeat protein